VALSGVRLTVLGRPGFGQTLSRTDGMFDMAVNGGGILIVHYEKAGFLPAQRPINAPWQNFAFLPDVALIPVQSKAPAPPSRPASPNSTARHACPLSGDMKN
jgi:hypothetical protein